MRLKVWAAVEVAVVMTNVGVNSGVKLLMRVKVEAVVEVEVRSSAKSEGGDSCRGRGVSADEGGGSRRGRGRASIGGGISAG